MSQDSPPQENRPHYNLIFTKLVLQQDPKSRLFGMIAYSRYKLEKSRWLTKIPNHSPEQLAAFLVHYDDDKLDELVKSAEDFVLAYAEEYAQEQIRSKLDRYKETVLADEFKTLNHELSHKIDKTRVNFWLPIWQSIVASIIFTFALFILALLIRFAAPDSNAGRILQYLFAPDNYQLELKPIRKNEK